MEETANNSQSERRGIGALAKTGIVTAIGMLVIGFWWCPVRQFLEARGQVLLINAVVWFLIFWRVSYGIARMPKKQGTWALRVFLLVAFVSTLFSCFFEI